MNATITYAQIDNAIQVPTAAVTTTDSGSTVTVRSNGHEAPEVSVYRRARAPSGHDPDHLGVSVGEKAELPTFNLLRRGRRSTGKLDPETAVSSGASPAEVRPLASPVAGRERVNGEVGSPSPAVIRLAHISKTYQTGSLAVEALHDVDR